MSSNVSGNIGEIYEQPLSGDNPGYDYLELDPTTMISRKPDNEMRPGPTKTPTQRADVKDSSNHVVSDKIMQLVETNALLKTNIASLKTKNSVLIFVIVVYGIFLLVLGLVVTGVIGGFKDDKVDRVPPTIICPPDQIVSPACNTRGTYQVTLQPCTATDDSGTVNLVSQSHQSGQYFLAGPTEVTFTFADDTGNRASGSYTVNVVEGNCTSTAGAVYVRWGRTTCPTVSEITYAGIAGGKWYAHTGSGSNYLCLPENPEYDVYKAGVDQLRGYVYSAEYEIVNFPPYAGKHNHDAPCAVCRTTNRGSIMMIPAKMTCPSGWTEEYHGYLMSDYYDRPSGHEFVCVDRNIEVVPGGLNDDHGAVFYPVEGRCDGGHLPCTPYINGAELTCVVCSK